MANRVDTGVTVKGPSQAPGGRRFPWRLWLYAIAITGAAGYVGYLGYCYRERANDADDKLGECNKKVTAGADMANKLTLCTNELGKATLAAKDLDAKLAEGTKNLTASAAELVALRAQKAEADKRMAAIEDIRKQFAKMVDTGQLTVVARHGELVVSLPSEVLFPTGSAELSKPGEYAVVEVAAVLKKFPDRRFLIVGHTDNQDFAKPKGGAGSGSAAATASTCIPADNWQLSTERALTVTRVMTTAGMKPENLIAAGEGEHDPIASNATADGRQKNRRIEIALLPALSELPPLPPSLTEGAPAK